MQDDKENMSVLNAFDFTAIDEMDPSLGEGHRLYYDREVPFELRIQDANTGKQPLLIHAGPQEVGSLEAIRVKLLVAVSDNET